MHMVLTPNYYGDVEFNRSADSSWYIRGKFADFGLGIAELNSEVESYVIVSFIEFGEDDTSIYIDRISSEIIVR